MQNGISVSPALVQIDLADHPNVFEITYTNHTSIAYNLKLAAQDFSPLDESWKIKYLDTADSQTYHYSLSSWLQFSPSELILLPQQSRTIEVTIRTTDLSPGGHYASVIGSFSPGFAASSSAVTIQGQLISQVFVRTHTGLERVEGKINSFSKVENTLFSLPQNYLLRFDNSGNVELTPRGVLIIKDLLGHEVARGILNEDAHISLPESIRRYEIPISIKQPVYLLPGPYQASITVNYGQPPISSSLSFFSFGTPLNFIAILLILLLFIVSLRNLLKALHH